MDQAYKHLKEGSKRYLEINELLKDLILTWNETHKTKSDARVISDAAKRIFEYNHWIMVDDIKPVFDLGLMGKFGENMGLNAETLFRWFSTYSREQREKNKPMEKKVEISIEQRKKTRNECLKIFKSQLDNFKRSGSLGENGKQYLPLWISWFVKIRYMDYTQDDLKKYRENQLKGFRDPLRNSDNRKLELEFYEKLEYIISEKINVIADLEKMAL